MADQQQIRRPMNKPINRIPAALQASGASTSETRRVLALIGSSEEGMTTTELRTALGTDGRRIRGLLKAPADRGEVTYSYRRWRLNPHYVCPHVRKVVEELRAAGWTVTEPWNNAQKEKEA
jgi:hypothetical protein